MREFGKVKYIGIHIHNMQKQETLNGFKEVRRGRLRRTTTRDEGDNMNIIVNFTILTIFVTGRLIFFSNFRVKKAFPPSPLPIKKLIK